jgi:hypothetical protein
VCRFRQIVCKKLISSAVQFDRQIPMFRPHTWKATSAARVAWCWIYLSLKLRTLSSKGRRLVTSHRPGGEVSAAIAVQLIRFARQNEPNAKKSEREREGRRRREEEAIERKRDAGVQMVKMIGISEANRLIC